MWQLLQINKKDSPLRISHNYKFIFLSNPRCGSTSIRKILDPYSDIISSKTYLKAIIKQFLKINTFYSISTQLFKSTFYYLTHINDENPYQHHVNARRLKSHFEALNWDWDKYYSFAILRNPWDRVVSFYHFGLSNSKSIWSKWAKSKDFESFVKCEEVIKLLKQYNFYNFVCNKNGDSLINKIIKLENINNELPLLLKSLNINLKIDIPKLNSTQRSDYRNYYNDDTINLIKQYFHSDIEFGKYTF